MYNGSDRRSAARKDSDYHVTLMGNGEESAGHVQDLSSGGALIVVSVIPPRGTLVRISWSLIPDSLPLMIDAEVVWTMAGDGAANSSAIGVRWLRVDSPGPDALRVLLKETLEVSGGFAKMGEKGPDGTRIVHFEFPAPAISPSQNDALPPAEDDEVPAAPTPAGESTQEDSPANGSSAAVLLPTKYRTQGKARKGNIVTLAERRVVVETDGSLPSHSDRVELKVSLPSSEGILPLKLYGQVSRTREATPTRPASFWVLVTRVDEYGRGGLFRQYVEHLG